MSVSMLTAGRCRPVPQPAHRREQETRFRRRSAAGPRANRLRLTRVRFLRRLPGPLLRLTLYPDSSLLRNPFRRLPLIHFRHPEQPVLLPAGHLAVLLPAAHFLIRARSLPFHPRSSLSRLPFLLLDCGFFHILHLCWC